MKADTSVPLSGARTNATEPGRVIACNRTLNMRSIKAIGYDMDYTLVHYRVEEWERRAYEHIQRKLSAAGWPVDHLEFDPHSITRGLIVDLEYGNVVKANRFGFVKKAKHGSRFLDFETQRQTYARTIISLDEPRWYFLNTLFSLSEGCIYQQLVDLLDEGRLPAALGYADLFNRVRAATDEAHMEGILKSEILASPDQYVVPDEETALALLDQKYAGKKLLLITNSEWSYTRPMMEYAFDRFLPAGLTWRSLFDVIIVSARKPSFFTTKSPLYEVANSEGLLRETDRLQEGKIHVGGSAAQLEKHLGLSGDEILYVGDHMFGDVHVSKNVLRWRTALILRELESEMSALLDFSETEQQLAMRMKEKEAWEERSCALRLELQRLQKGYGPRTSLSEGEIQEQLAAVRATLMTLDHDIAPLAKAASSQGNEDWGLLLRAGNDKSHLARQVERYADIYTSRVSNFLAASPFVYLRSPRGSLPHDPIG